MNQSVKSEIKARICARLAMHKAQRRHEKPKTKTNNNNKCTGMFVNKERV